SLLDAGAHFGHQTHRWNPKMLQYIYGERNGIHIINLDLTLKHWQKARKFLFDVAARGGNVLFVGTKHQTRESVEFEAQRSKSFFVTNRWLGGTLSNFQTIRTAIERMKKLEDLLAQAEQENSKVKLVKKERVSIRKELDKLQASLGGIRDLRKVPDAVFITDIVKESIAVAECQKLHIPVVGLVDTNADPDQVEFPIPSNDDAPRVTKLLLASAADAITEGRRVFEASNPQESEGGRRRQARTVESETSRASEASPG
ncbi:MAG: 30S ribosomal protein S2, partial [Proteobacteria bacterium]|nr:30S ribosomal protein S2 [Pseudomonadota bacterium]